MTKQNDKLVQAIAMSLDFCDKNGVETFISYIEKFYENNDFLIHIVCNAYDIGYKQLINVKCVVRNVVDARRTIMYILKYRKGYDNKQLSEVFGLKIRTVRDSINCIKEYLENEKLNPTFIDKYNNIIKKFENELQ